ncbi:hypothetical protein ACFYPZ_40595 [Streptomyces sp. NPDC005506]|uniref:hypothetical protein n=1 Tax=unclassified Streptomyces TaxID=2593676 RepID=UPI0036B76077
MKREITAHHPLDTSTDSANSSNDRALRRRVSDAFVSAAGLPWTARSEAGLDFTLSPSDLAATTPETYLTVSPETLAHRRR